MIRRLRWKIVAINMAMVTAVLLAVFAGVLLSSRAAVERSVNQRLLQVIQTGRYDASLPGQGSAPCFVADIYPSGTVRLSGSSYYQLDDQDAVADIVTACLEQGSESGVLRAYHLRYLRADGPLYTRIAFTDAAQEDDDQAAVDAAKKALEDAHTALVKVEQINKEALKAAIDAAKAADANLYTTDSYKAMKTVLSDAEKVLKDSKDQTEIDAAAKALNDAVTALVQRGNTDALKALIEEYKDLKEADYTADSWKEYADALKAAKAIVEDNSNSDQAAVDAALNALRDARVALKLSGKPSVDKSELQAAYDKYKDKKNDGYTAESWAKFENALKSAKAILDNEAATADQVKAALAQLNSAAEGLTKTQTPPKNDPQTPSTPSQGGSVQTGDTAHVALWLVLAGMSVIAYVAVRRKRA